MKDGFFILRKEVLRNKEEVNTTETSDQNEYTQIKNMNTGVNSMLGENSFDSMKTYGRRNADQKSSFDRRNESLIDFSQYNRTPSIEMSHSINDKMQISKQEQKNMKLNELIDPGQIG